MKDNVYDIYQLLLLYPQTLAFAESCTGGLLSHMFTNVPGSSSYLLGGIVCYANEIKHKILHIPRNILIRPGAVSEEVAILLARHVRELFNADIGISITGIAGPGGGTKRKPVGTTWIGFSSISLTRADHYLWKGDRIQNKEMSVQRALEILKEYLESGSLSRAK